MKGVAYWEEEYRRNPLPINREKLLERGGRLIAIETRKRRDGHS